MMFLATLKAKLIAAAGGLLAILGLLFTAYRKGQKDKHNEVQAETAKTIIETVKERQEVEKANRDIGPDARRNRLFDEYSDDS